MDDTLSRKRRKPGVQPVDDNSDIEFGPADSENDDDESDAGSAKGSGKRKTASFATRRKSYKPKGLVLSKAKPLISMALALDAVRVGKTAKQRPSLAKLSGKVPPNGRSARIAKKSSAKVTLQSNRAPKPVPVAVRKGPASAGTSKHAMQAEVTMSNVPKLAAVAEAGPKVFGKENETSGSATQPAKDELSNLSENSTKEKLANEQQNQATISPLTTDKEVKSSKTD